MICDKVKLYFEYIFYSNNNHVELLILVNGLDERRWSTGYALLKCRPAGRVLQTCQYTIMS